MTEIQIRQEFIRTHLREAREKMLSASQELMQSLNKSKRRASLLRFIGQQLKKIELYQEGKLDIDAEISLQLLLEQSHKS